MSGLDKFLSVDDVTTFIIGDKEVVNRRVKKSKENHKKKNNL